MIGFLARICNKSSLEGTLCKCCNGDNFNKCMDKATMDGLGCLAKGGVVIVTVCAFSIFLIM